MKNNNFCVPEFFLGANTPRNFYSLFKELYNPDDDWFCHILKGGPGTGKSTLMKNISKKYTEQKISHEIIRCSSDPDSLDAVICEETKKSIVDGTAPHIIDPVYPGVSDEIINLGEFWKSKTLQKNKQKIMSLSKEIAKSHKLSTKFLNIFSYAHSQNTKIIKSMINYDNLNIFCEKFINKLKLNKLDIDSKIKKRFISSVTPQGYILLEKTAEQLCDKLFVIQDDYNIISNIILSYVCDYARNSNYNMIICPSPFDPDNIIESVFLPDINIGFVTKNQFLDSEVLSNLDTKTEIINTKKFINRQEYSDFRNIINFNNKMCKKFLAESVQALEKAKKIHDDLENIYSSSMNYSKLDKIISKIATGF